MAQHMNPQDPHQSSWLDWVPITCFLLALAAVAIVYFTVPGSALDRLTVIVGYVILMLLFFFGLMVLFAMARGKIDLSLLLSEQGEPGASMSRFQLLIFTFVIAFSLFLITVASRPMRFPAIPSEILMLLGISASTYAVSKGIQSSSPGMGKKKDAGAAGGAPPPPAPQQQQQQQASPPPPAPPAQG